MTPGCCQLPLSCRFNMKKRTAKIAAASQIFSKNTIGVENGATEKKSQVQNTLTIDYQLWLIVTFFIASLAVASAVLIVGKSMDILDAQNTHTALGVVSYCLSIIMPVGMFGNVFNTAENLDRLDILNRTVYNDILPFPAFWMDNHTETYVTGNDDIIIHAEHLGIDIEVVRSDMECNIGLVVILLEYFTAIVVDVLHVDIFQQTFLDLHPEHSNYNTLLFTNHSMAILDTTALKSKRHITFVNVIVLALGVICVVACIEFSKKNKQILEGVQKFEDTIRVKSLETHKSKQQKQSLLNQMLPKSVADRLRAGKKVEAECFDNVSIYFSDIIGFNEVALSRSPLEIVDFLNSVYG